MSKLHPVYVALDNHQYSRAIKLASALPDSNVLGKALLAHAYYKSGQRYLSVVTLYKILGDLAGDGNYFCELKHEVEYALEAVEERRQLASNPAVASVPEPAPTSTSKKGKKGKKKPAVAAKPTTPAKVETDKSLLDLIDQLNKQPTLPRNWDALPKSASEITDETILGTLSMTLTGLKLPLTAYMLYAWAATSDEATDEALQETFRLGLAVLAAPSRWTVECRQQIEAHVIPHIQTVALQWARLYVNQPGGLSTFHPMLATAWAAQAALWQLQWLPEDPKRSMILPRLAESMAQKLIQQEEESKSQSAEVQTLALRAFRQQSKWEEMLEILGKQLCCESDDEPRPAVITDFGVSMTAHQVMTEKARILCQVERYEEAKAVYQELIAKSPDDWSYWKGHLQCCSKLDSSLLTKELVEGVLSQRAAEKYPLRGPHLMQVELEADKFRRDPCGSALAALSLSIQKYSQLFASRAVCAFSDLEAYIELALSTKFDTSNQVAEDLLQFAQTFRSSNASAQEGDKFSNKERQCRLRAYIFSVKLNHTVLAEYTDLQGQWLPDWAELVNEWKSTLVMNSSTEGEETQKEVKPGDDLALLAVQQLLYKNPGDVGCQVICAALLEKAMEHSPDNAYLKITAIHVYYQLNALSRSWKCYQGMALKYVQLDSCTFTILPYLLKGGLYNEAIEVCNALLRFHINSCRDCGDYAGRAMGNGKMGKADEFLVFQREKMNRSLSALDAKGVILDCASVLAIALPSNTVEEEPIFQGGLGILQGIVGGDDDMTRATQMIVEAHNPSAALSLVSWADHYSGGVRVCDSMVDNRDLSIHCQHILLQIPPPSKEEMSRDALRRGYTHGLLIRATLCVDAAKGPKKGKIVKPSEQLVKRANSFLDCVATFGAFMDEHSIQEGGEGECCKAILEATVELCRTMAVINAGLPSVDTDSLEDREKRACDFLQSKTVPKLKQAASSTALSSVKTVCSLLPSSIVPLCAVFRMCGTICDLYGWGKRKHKTKRCAKALQDVAIEFQGIIANMLVSMASLPSADDASGESISVELQDEYRSLMDEAVVTQTLNDLAQAQNRTRQRVEPILQEMHDYLDTFNVNED